MFERLWARVHPSARRCQTCESFDLSAGQQALGDFNPIFAEVIRQRSPDQLSKQAKVAELLKDVPEGEQPPVEPAAIPEPQTGAQWAEFGLCRKSSQLCWRKGTCDGWR